MRASGRLEAVRGEEVDGEGQTGSTTTPLVKFVN